MSNNNDGGGVLVIVFIVGAIIFGIGYWAGAKFNENTVYVFDSKQPVRPHFVEDLPVGDDYQTLSITFPRYEGREYVIKNYILYYWENGGELYWTWREVIGP